VVNFPTVIAALSYVVGSLIPRRHRYIVEMRGPDGFNAGQFVDEGRVFGGPARGLTLRLAFGGTGRTVREERFLACRQSCSFVAVPRNGNRCYAARFGTDIQTALRLHWAVALAAYYNSDSMQFECSVHDEGERAGLAGNDR
jgi:hypothetical protein